MTNLNSTTTTDNGNSRQNPTSSRNNPNNIHRELKKAFKNQHNQIQVNQLQPNGRKSDSNSTSKLTEVKILGIFDNRRNQFIHVKSFKPKLPKLKKQELRDAQPPDFR